MKKVLSFSFIVAMLLHIILGVNVVQAEEQEVPPAEPLELTIDFSEVTIHDENGDFLEKETMLARSTNSVDFSENKDVFQKEPILANSIDLSKNEIGILGYTGGSTSSGSGYKVVKGAKVSGSTTDSARLRVSFSCDFTLVQSGYDTLDRVYGIEANGGGSVSYLKTGVLRRKETVEYSAFGGVRLQHEYGGTSGSSPRTQTYWLYIRVGKDRHWLDSNLYL